MLSIMKTKTDWCLITTLAPPFILKALIEIELCSTYLARFIFGLLSYSASVPLQIWQKKSFYASEKRILKIIIRLIDIDRIIMPITSANVTSIDQK